MHISDTGLLAAFPQRDGQQIALSVRMAARPGPHPVNIVVGHEHPGAVGIDHKAGAGQVGDLVVPGEDIVRKQPDILQNHALVCRLPLVPGDVGADLVQIHAQTLLRYVR